MNSGTTNKAVTTMTTRSAHIAIVSFALAGLSLPAHAVSDRLSSGMGHDLAQMTCASCHLIEPGQKDPPDHVGGPTFQEIADRPHVAAANLREHLLDVVSEAQSRGYLAPMAVIQMPSAVADVSRFQG